MNQQLLAGIILLFLHYQLLFVIVIPLVLWDLSVISYLLICSFVVPGFFLFVMAWLQFLFLFFLISEEISVVVKICNVVVVILWHDPISYLLSIFIVIYQFLVCISSIFSYFLLDISSFHFYGSCSLLFFYSFLLVFQIDKRLRDGWIPAISSLLIKQKIAVMNGIFSLTKAITKRTSIRKRLFVLRRLLVIILYRIFSLFSYYYLDLSFYLFGHY